MAIWTSEIKEIEKLYSSIKGQFPALEKELAELILTNDPNVLMLYSRRCLHKTISNKRLAGVLSGLIAIIAAVFAVLYFSDVIGDTKAGRELEKSIAVLPFKLLSDEPDKQYLADEYNRNWKDIFSVQRFRKDTKNGG